MKTLLKLHQINAGYNQSTVLSDVNLTVYENDFIGIIGPNGGGKTTLLKIILGLMLPQSGSISFPGLEKGVRSLGYLPQSSTFDHQFPILVKDVILSGLAGQSKLWQKPSKHHQQKASQLIEQVRMESYANTPIGELSGGQRQRVLLCRALIHEPKLLILDEPSTYVDKHFEGEIYDILKELNEHIAILLVSHDVGIISSFVKTIACVNGTLHHHSSNKITPEVLVHYNCPVELISHGNVPHRVLKTHS